MAVFIRTTPNQSFFWRKTVSKIFQGLKTYSLHMLYHRAGSVQAKADSLLHYTHTPPCQFMVPAGGTGAIHNAVREVSGASPTKQSPRVTLSHPTTTASVLLAPCSSETQERGPRHDARGWGRVTKPQEHTVLICCGRSVTAEFADIPFPTAPRLRSLELSVDFPGKKKCVELRTIEQMVAARVRTLVAHCPAQLRTVRLNPCAQSSPQDWGVMMVAGPVCRRCCWPCQDKD